MNNKGAMSIGTIVILAVTIILGAVFANSIADSQSTLTTTVTIANQTISGSNSTTTNLDGQAISDVVVYNGTALVPSTNYTVSDLQSVNGQYRATFTPNSAPAHDFEGYNWNISGTLEPIGYNQDAGSRGIGGLPLLFFVLGVLATAFLGVKDWIDNN